MPNAVAPGRRAGLVAVAVLAAVVLGAAWLRADGPPAERAARSWLVGFARPEALPDDVALGEDLARAVDLRHRERFDRVLDARDPGELIEHATLSEPMFAGVVLTPRALFTFGDEFFAYLFRPENGWGKGDAAARKAIGYTPHPQRVHDGARGGPDAFGCASCHFKGGPDGAGMQTENAFLFGDGRGVASAEQRNPPHVLGLGAVELLGREMTAALQAEAAAVVARAGREGRRVEEPLAAKGVSFGRIAADPDGAVDRSFVDGIDADLVVRPFGWKGHQATLRGMIEESLHIHHGLVSVGIQRAARAGTLDGSIYGTGKKWSDLDDDGVEFEVDSGMIATVVGYLAQLEVPVVRPPRDPGLLDLFAAGRDRFDAIGCAGCHVPVLELDDTKLDIRRELTVDVAGPPLVVDVAKDGDGPKVEPKYAGPVTSYLVHLFSDLKRHDMGETLASSKPQGGIPPRVFLTRSLWGLAETAPYLHDGRAPTVDEAILLHGGEAAAARDAYRALDATARASVRVFLLSLSRQPKIFVP